MTILAIIVAATIAGVIGLGIGYAAALEAIRKSGYVIESVPGAKVRFRIGVRADAAPVVPAVEWIASAREAGTPLPVKIANTNAVRVDYEMVIDGDAIARLGHKPRGGGRP